MHQTMTNSIPSVCPTSAVIKGALVGLHGMYQ
jgi:hypothetical protein